MDDPIIKEQLALFIPEYQALVTGSVPELAADTFGTAYKLSEHDTVVLENSFRLYLLALLSKSEWVEFISDYTILDLETAQLVVDEISTYISPEIHDTVHHMTSGVEENPSPSPSPEGKDTGNDLRSEIAETKEALSHIPPLRTMHSDQKQATAEPQESVHTSSQSDILSPEKEPSSNESQPSKPTLSAIPRKPQSDSRPDSEADPTNTAPVPRWDSERE